MYLKKIIYIIGTKKFFVSSWAGWMMIKHNSKQPMEG